MGFDILYLPPIHPIGKQFRKGKNNSSEGAPDDPGSPWAIGSEEGGHRAIHPELGTMEDFHHLLSEARRRGLEVALDMAFQCSADHPYLREHPDWTGWLEWYGVRLDLTAPVLCGSAGFHGPPDDRGVVEIGYSMLPSHQRLGLATEMVAALVVWARSQSAVSRVEAQTTVDNPASIRVLEHVGFRPAGPFAEAGTVRYCIP